MKETNTNSISYLTSSAIAILAFGIGVFGGIKYEQNLVTEILASKDFNLQEKENTITDLKNSLLKVQEEAVSTPKIISNITPTPTPSPTPISNISKFTAPVKNSRLCRNSTFPFTWYANPTKIDQVRLRIDTDMFPSGPYASIPVTWNEEGIEGKGVLEWKVGTAKFETAPDNFAPVSQITLPDGELYYSTLEVLQNGRVIEARKVGPFAIDTCEG